MDNKLIYTSIEQEDGPGPCKCMLFINKSY